MVPFALEKSVGARVTKSEKEFKFNGLTRDPNLKDPILHGTTFTWSNLGVTLQVYKHETLTIVTSKF